MRSHRSVVEAGFRNLIRRLNADRRLQAVGIRIDRDIDHFIDRLYEREMDAHEVISAIARTFDERLGEVTSIVTMEKPPLRLNLVDERFVIGMTIRQRIDFEPKYVKLNLRTIVENSGGRSDSRVSTAFLDVPPKTAG